MSETAESLQEIFDSKGSEQAAEAPPEPAEQPQAAADEGEADEASAQPDVNEQEPAEQANGEDDKPRMAPLEALQDERAKRRDAEQRIDALEAQLAALSSAPQPQPAADSGKSEASTFDATTAWPEDLDFFDDPKGAVSTVLSAQGKQFEKRIAETEARASQSITEMRAYFSEQAARAAHPDFDEKLAAFKTAMNDAPALLAQAQAHPDPARFVYDVGARSLLMQQYQDPKSMRAEIEAEVRAELEGKASSKKTPKTPGSLTDAGTGKGADNPAFDAAPSLTEVFNGR